MPPTGWNMVACMSSISSKSIGRRSFDLSKSEGKRLTRDFDLIAGAGGLLVAGARGALVFVILSQGAIGLEKFQHWRVIVCVKA
jgi:hypothetical protein